MNKLIELLEQNDISIEISEEAVDWLGREGYDPQYGARPLKRLIQREVLNKLSKMILSGEIDKSKAMKIEFKADHLVFEN